MNAEWFLATNILVYAAAAKVGEEWKQRRALELIESVDFGLSAQVIQEFYVTVGSAGANRREKWVHHDSANAVDKAEQTSTGSTANCGKTSPTGADNDGQRN